MSNSLSVDPLQSQRCGFTCLYDNADNRALPGKNRTLDKLDSGMSFERKIFEQHDFFFFSPGAAPEQNQGMADEKFTTGRMHAARLLDESLYGREVGSSTAPTRPNAFELAFFCSRVILSQLFVHCSLTVRVMTVYMAAQNCRKFIKLVCREVRSNVARGTGGIRNPEYWIRKVIRINKITRSFPTNFRIKRAPRDPTQALEKRLHP